jgi:hypothetical protein
MTLIRVSVIAAFAACTASIVLAQEQAATATAAPDESALQKRCADKADHDKLEDKLRPTFMMECAANGRLDVPKKPAEQK